MRDIKILLNDSRLCAVFKPCGMPSQADKTGDTDLVSYLEKYLNTPLNIINRLDRPVSGITLFAKDGSPAAALSRDMQEGGFVKEYEAVLCGVPDKRNGIFTDFLFKDQRSNISRVVKEGVKGAKAAKLEYTVLDTVDDEEFETLSLVKIRLFTGRHHQIRVQFASRGVPLWGDAKYNAAFIRRRGRFAIALCACGLKFRHPQTGETVELSARDTSGAFEKFLLR